MRTIRVGYTVEMDGKTFDRLATRAIRMGYPFEGKLTEAKKLALVRRLLKECGRSEMHVLRYDEENPPLGDSEVCPFCEDATRCCEHRCQGCGKIFGLGTCNNGYCESCCEVHCDGEERP